MEEDESDKSKSEVNDEGDDESGEVAIDSLLPNSKPFVCLAVSIHQISVITLDHLRQEEDDE